MSEMTKEYIEVLRRVTERVSRGNTVVLRSEIIALCNLSLEALRHREAIKALGQSLTDPRLIAPNGMRFLSYWRHVCLEGVWTMFGIREDGERLYWDGSAWLGNDGGFYTEWKLKNQCTFDGKLLSEVNKS